VGVGEGEDRGRGSVKAADAGRDLGEPHVARLRAGRQPHERADAGCAGRGESTLRARAEEAHDGGAAGLGEGDGGEEVGEGESGGDEQRSTGASKVTA
jgi:hypothetical protein